jgi:hypothetical protein
MDRFFFVFTNQEYRHFEASKYSFVDYYIVLVEFKIHVRNYIFIDQV